MNPILEKPIVRIGLGMGGGLGVAGLAFLVLKFFCAAVDIQLVQSQVLGPILTFAACVAILIALNLSAMMRHRQNTAGWIYVPISGLVLIGHLLGEEPEAIVAGRWGDAVGSAILVGFAFLIELFRHAWIRQQVEKFEAEQASSHQTSANV